MQEKKNKYKKRRKINIYVLKNSRNFRNELREDVAFVCSNADSFGLMKENISVKKISEITGYDKRYVDWAFLSLRRAGRV